MPTRLLDLINQLMLLARFIFVCTSSPCTNAIDSDIPGLANLSRSLQGSLQRALLLCSLCCILIACTTVPEASERSESTAANTSTLQRDKKETGTDEDLNSEDFKPYWWYIRFRLNWPEQEAPDWTLDTLLADLVCAPALADFGQTIQLWRFHRRAARDGAGRQFSFIFYTDPYSAQAINRHINSNTLVQELLLRSHLSKVTFEQSSNRQNLEDTSDTSWSPIVQKSWPFFIMGVSETWLDLITQLALDLGLDETQNLPTLLAGYEKVSEAVDEIWKLHGNHAFLHHLNAVFGYKPTLMRY